MGFETIKMPSHYQVAPIASVKMLDEISVDINESFELDAKTLKLKLDAIEQGYELGDPNMFLLDWEEPIKDTSK